MDFTIAGASVAATGLSSGQKSVLDLPGDLLDVLPAAVYVCDAAGLIVQCNRKAVELWGRMPKLGDREDRFCGSWRLYRLEDGPLPHKDCPMAEVLRTGQAVRDQEVIIERSDGSRIIALVNVSPLRDTDGSIAGAVNCFQDITERKRAEAAQRERERQFRALLDALPAAIYTTDAAGRITYYNQAAVDLSGNRPKLGSDEWCVTFRLYWPDGRPLPHDQCPMAVALKKDRPVRGEEVIAERPDGSRVSVIPYPTPLHDESGRLVGAVNMLVEISERKRAEEQQKLLIREMDHRVKNLFAVTNGMLALSARSARTPRDMAEAVQGRLNALSRAHGLTLPGISTSDPKAPQATTLQSLLREILAPFDEGTRDNFIINGPDVPIAASAVTNFALIWHEFATNAVKYGALSSPTGTIQIDCSVSNDELLVTWTERGGPSLGGPPQHEGFGAVLTSRIVKGQFGGMLLNDWRSDGLVVQVSMPLDRVAAPGAAHRRCWDRKQKEWSAPARLGRPPAPRPA